VKALFIELAPYSGHGAAAAMYRRPASRLCSGWFVLAMPPSLLSTRNFASPPPSVASLVAALAEPVLSVLAYLLTARALDRPLGTPDLTLCLLTFLISFPGPNRFYGNAARAGQEVLASWAAILLALAICGYLTDSLDLFNREMLLAWAVATPLAHWLLAVGGQGVVRARAGQAEYRRKAVVVGARALGVQVAQAIVERQRSGHDFIGYFDDRDAADLAPAAAGRLLGGLADVVEQVRRQGIHEVYITLPLGSQTRLAELIEALQRTTASLWFAPDVFGIGIIQGRLQEMNGVPVVGLCETPFTGVNRFFKRISDIVLASVAIVLLAPVMAVIAVAVKLESPGPAIFRQRRNGLDGREIVVYKFRSMRAMDDGARVVQATRGDPRITRLGAFLRRTSLDELPQFVNVLQGRMSVVGPRPHAVAHNEQYRDLIVAYMVRHKVKPGITGWAQVNGCRGETDTVDKMRARIAFDLEYLRGWSLWLDLRIVLRTIGLVFGDRHAY
jgi:putative colanic acid biosysnthesis UDP-glucose lipid carrier transferase